MATPRTNLERALAAIADCAADTELVVFPETHLTASPAGDNIAALTPSRSTARRSAQCKARRLVNV